MDKRGEKDMTDVNCDNNDCGNADFTVEVFESEEHQFRLEIIKKLRLTCTKCKESTEIVINLT